ncbi:MAG: hypothetical protein AAF490_30330, partial [Chloroflexota bacterium]
VVVLYREVDSYEWQLLELTYDPIEEYAYGAIEADKEIEVLVQAVDSSGNVAYGLDYGTAFSQAEATEFLLFLPLIDGGD